MEISSCVYLLTIASENACGTYSSIYCEGGNHPLMFNNQNTGRFSFIPRDLILRNNRRSLSDRSIERITAMDQDEQKKFETTSSETNMDSIIENILKSVSSSGSKNINELLKKLYNELEETIENKESSTSSTASSSSSNKKGEKNKKKKQ